MAEPEIDTMSLSERVLQDLLHPKPLSREMIRIQEMMEEMLRDTRPLAAPLSRIATSAPVIPEPPPKPFPNKQSQGKRQCEIHLLIKRVFYALRNEFGYSPSGQDVFRRIELKHAKYDTDSIIDEVRDGYIFWTSMRGYEQKISFRTVENVVSKIRHGKI